MKEHITYDLAMMYYAIMRWRPLVYGTSNLAIEESVTIGFSNMVGFNSGYNLLSYMQERGGTLPLDPRIDSICNKIKTQVRTLGPGRTAEYSEKLKYSDLVKLFLFIEKNINRDWVEKQLLDHIIGVIPTLKVELIQSTNNPIS